MAICERSQSLQSIPVNAESSCEEITKRLDRRLAARWSAMVQVIAGLLELVVVPCAAIPLEISGIEIVERQSRFKKGQDFDPASVTFGE